MSNTELVRLPKITWKRRKGYKENKCRKNPLSQKRGKIFSRRKFRGAKQKRQLRSGEKMGKKTTNYR